MLKWILLLTLSPVFTTIAQVPQEVEVICMCDSEAQFPGGQRSLYEYIQQNMRPIAAQTFYRENSTKVYVAFVVEETGAITNVKIERGFCKEVDDEIVRLIQEMPDWLPHTSGCGDVYRTNVRMPISVDLR